MKRVNGEKTRENETEREKEREKERERERRNMKIKTGIALGKNGSKILRKGKADQLEIYSDKEKEKREILKIKD